MKWKWKHSKHAIARGCKYGFLWDCIWAWNQTLVICSTFSMLISVNIPMHSIVDESDMHVANPDITTWLQSRAGRYGPKYYQDKLEIIFSYQSISINITINVKSLFLSSHCPKKRRNFQNITVIVSWNVVLRVRRECSCLILKSVVYL